MGRKVPVIHEVCLHEDSLEIRRLRSYLGHEEEMQDQELIEAIDRNKTRTHIQLCKGDGFCY